jgi:phage terminase Nu1 subunit (DNA packaging protein)
MEAQDYETYVDADAVAAFLKMKRKTVLEWARRGIVPAHSWGQGRRKVWRFLISEIARQGNPVQSTIEDGSPEIARLEKKYG